MVLTRIIYSLPSSLHPEVQIPEISVRALCGVRVVYPTVRYYVKKVPTLGSMVKSLCRLSFLHRGPHDSLADQASPSS